ncbi:MAG: hypothetical protein KOO62_10885 [candidate division Zixibacteria bacterium]|nr:hypothetical protein [candidate division Zixibacteria bacterium]
MKNRHILIRLALLFLVLGLIGATSVRAQFYFGKNKVQYTRFNWQLMTTEHFRLYFYETEMEVARMAARSAEDSYRLLAARFNHEIEDKIPLIIYSSPNYFTQTNIVPGLLPESVAGFTEFMKGRVVLPFHGSYHELDHVIRHELVHVFTFDKIDQTVQRRSRIKVAYPPLWFTEGIAEFWSEEWDSDADMFVKDMVINERLFGIPELYRIRGTYFMYKLGQSICAFIDSAYGPDKLMLIFDEWYKGRTFNEIVKNVLGDDLKELSRKWEYSLRKKYYPQLADLGLPDMESDRITSDGYSVKGVPLMWDDGDGLKEWVVFKANRRGYSGIYMSPAEGPRKRTVRTLVKGERSSDLESLYLLRSGIDAHASGQIVFSSKSKEKDVIYIYDLGESSIVARYEFDSLAATRSPQFSPDGSKIVFSGVRLSGFTDIYVLDLSSGNYESLTDDIYYDIDPVFAADGSSIIFVSDRCVEGQQGATNLYEYELSSGALSQLTNGPYSDQSPDGTEDGIYFSSDREGCFNLFLLDHDGSLSRQSTFVTGAFDPRLTPDGEHLVYTGYQDMSFQIYRMALPTEPETIAQTSPASQRLWKPLEISSEYSRASIKYDTDYSLDIAQSSIGYDPVYGSLGGFQLAISDVLGNHAYYLLLANTASTKDEFLESFNIGITHVNREKRINYGLGAYHIYDEYFNDYDGFFEEREAGIFTLLSYPFSKFHRIDLTNLAAYNKRYRRYGLRDREAFLGTHYLSWVYDNSLWDISGPIEGRRYNFTVGATNRLETGEHFNRMALIDVRHYFRLGRYSAVASRLFGYSSTGIDPQRIHFGGSWSFRGYDRRRFYVRNVLFSSTELRFPLIDHLQIGFPFGGLGFRAIRGALFFDVAYASDTGFRTWRYDDFLGSFGAGVRLALGRVILLRFDYIHTTDFNTITPKADFDFFFGWNF